MLENKNKPVFGPLSDVKVVHAAASLAGPFGAQLMADFGAEVTWIENPDIPDVSRFGKSIVVEHERRNSRNLALNIPSPEGKEVFLRIMKETDIFIEASKGGQYAKWGLTDEVLWKANPQLVIVHVSGFGQTGLPDYVSRASFDAIAQAFSGIMNQNGFPDRKPVSLVPFTGDYFTGLYTAVSALSALHRARSTGQGESIDLAQYEVLMRSQIYAADYMTNGYVFDREGSRSAIYAGWGTYTCKDDRDIYMVFMGGGTLKRGLPLFGLEYGSEMYPQGSSLIKVASPAGELLEKRIAEYLSQRTAAEAEQELLASGVPVSRIMNYEDLSKDPHVRERKVFTRWENFYGQMITGIDTLPRLKNNPGKVWRAAPRLGMDNEEILSEIGYSPEQIQELYAKKIIGKDKDL